MKKYLSHPDSEVVKRILSVILAFLSHHLASGLKKYLYESIIPEFGPLLEDKDFKVRRKVCLVWKEFILYRPEGVQVFIRLPSFASKFV